MDKIKDIIEKIEKYKLTEDEKKLLSVKDQCFLENISAINDQLYEVYKKGISDSQDFLQD